MSPEPQRKSKFHTFDMVVKKLWALMRTRSMGMLWQAHRQHRDAVAHICAACGCNGKHIYNMEVLWQVHIQHGGCCGKHIYSMGSTCNGKRVKWQAREMASTYTAWG